MKKTVSFAFALVAVSLLTLACSRNDAQPPGPSAKAPPAKTLSGGADTVRGATAQATPSAAASRAIH